MKQYVAQGIPFVIGDYAQEPASEEDIVWETFVGHNMRALGESAGAVAVEYLKTLDKDDPVCLFISRPTSGQVSVDRFEGFRDTVMAAFPERARDRGRRRGAPLARFGAEPDGERAAARGRDRRGLRP